LALPQALELDRFYPQKLEDLDRRLAADPQRCEAKSRGEGLEPRPRQRRLSPHEPRFTVRQ
jgi:hypothetical protein